jgi:hypothetical protein
VPEEIRDCAAVSGYEKVITLGLLCGRSRRVTMTRYYSIRARCRDCNIEIHPEPNTIMYILREAYDHVLLTGHVMEVERRDGRPKILINAEHTKV